MAAESARDAKKPRCSSSESTRAVASEKSTSTWRRKTHRRLQGTPDRHHAQSLEPRLATLKVPTRLLRPKKPSQRTRSDEAQNSSARDSPLALPDRTGGPETNRDDFDSMDREPDAPSDCRHGVSVDERGDAGVVGSGGEVGRRASGVGLRASRSTLCDGQRVSGRPPCWSSASSWARCCKGSRCSGQRSTVRAD